ncbi:MAG: ATP-binding cassette domain-containing protein [Myxococcales bacterium]|nr:ATP-binding cassette domain-containing protein [Myxococcales bacterium]
MSTSKSTNAIVVNELTKSYGAFKAVKGVSFEIPKGQIVGFLGPNGAGKSTVMKVLTCFMSATSGDVQVAGFDVYRDPLKVRRAVGYQPENVPLYEEMVVVDYLLFMAKMRGVKRADRKARLEHVMTVCSLGDVAAKTIGELSKGYKQRVGLAQALIHDPEVVILDEPMSGLDPNQILEIRDLIKAVGRTKTVIFSSHILQEIEKLCDRVLILDHGKIVADGTVAELQAKLGGNLSLEEVFRELTKGDRQSSVRPPQTRTSEAQPAVSEEEEPTVHEATDADADVGTATANSPPPVT